MELPGMTPEQIRLVQESFRSVLPIREQAAALFYERLFRIDPTLRPLFSHTDLKSQGKKLMAAIGFVVGALRRPEQVLPVACDLARRHVAYGVREEHYATVGAALLWTLEKGLGKSFPPAVRDAWAAAYGLLSGAMIAAAAAATREDGTDAAGPSANTLPAAA
jgi:hemoglobin-like flavoprotein